MIEILPDQLKASDLMGASAVAVAGAEGEIEDEPALSLWLGRWKKPVEIESFHLTLEQTSDGYSLLGWPDGITDADPAQSTLLLLGDPFTFPTDTFLDQVNEMHGGMRVVGGMASAARRPGQNPLLRDKVIPQE